MRLSALALTTSFFVLSNLAGAAQVKEPATELSIYNNNLALVKDVRPMDLTQGENKIAFEGVASAIKPESVIIYGEGIKVLEQNYDYQSGKM